MPIGVRGNDEAMGAIRWLIFDLIFPVVQAVLLWPFMMLYIAVLNWVIIPWENAKKSLEKGDWFDILMSFTFGMWHIYFMIVLAYVALID